MSFIWSLSALILSFIFTVPAGAQTEKVYDLRIHNMTLNRAQFAKTDAIGINGTSPGPTLRFQLGDTAVINVKNDLQEETSIHWHGLLVPWNMDGPSFTNNHVIKPGAVQQFRFKIKQTGTYWYHSHTMFQEQVGMHGAIVVEDDHHRFHGDHDLVMVLGDWTNEQPLQVVKNLKMDGDYYSMKKNFYPSLIDAIQRGQFWDYLKNEWTNMGQMDLSDVGYDAFLINGHREQSFKNIQPGEMVRLRLINAGASSYFYVNIGNMRPFMVVTKDGIEVDSVEVNELLMGMGETYDILFVMPEEDSPMAFELRATSMDTTGFASAILGEGRSIERPPTKVRPSPYVMNGHSGHGGAGEPGDQGGHGNHGDQGDQGDHGDHGKPGDHGNHGNHGNHGSESGKKPSEHGGHGDGSHTDHELPSTPALKVESPESGDRDGHDHDHNPGKGPSDDVVGVAHRLHYGMLRSVEPTAFPSHLKRHDMNVQLTGNMPRYTWYLNGKLFTEDKYLMIKENEVVRVKIDNQSMMRHPIHLHGHFFRVLNGQGDYSPNFHTVDIAPGQQLTIEFWANEPGLWFFHCHNLYHMETGMARLFKYEGFELPKELHEEEHAHHGSMMTDQTLFTNGEAKLYSNFGELNLRANGGNWEMTLQAEVDKYEIENLDSQMLFRRYLKPFLALVGGAEYEDQNLVGVLGMAYRLPMLVDMTSYVTTEGRVVLNFRKVIPIYGRLNLEMNPEIRIGGSESFDFNLENELSYGLSPNVRVGAFHRRTNEVGNTVGVGISIKFN